MSYSIHYTFLHSTLHTIVQSSKARLHYMDGETERLGYKQGQISLADFKVINKQGTQCDSNIPVFFLSKMFSFIISHVYNMVNMCDQQVQIIIHIHIYMYFTCFWIRTQLSVKYILYTCLTIGNTRDYSYYVV